MSLNNLKIKRLHVSKLSSGGRNITGRITVRHRGGGHKRAIRLINFDRHRMYLNIPSVVVAQEKDPNRKAAISLISYSNGVLCYILSTTFNDKSFIISSQNVLPLSSGNCFPIKHMPIGSLVHNIAHPNMSSSFVRAAGTSAQILRKRKNSVLFRLPSKELRYFDMSCFATLGVVSLNENTSSQCKLYKAGQSRWLGRRPHVRGVAMNPIDHPHGGGQGKTSGGRPSVSPWAYPTKGAVTRKYNKNSSKYIFKRKKNIK